MRKILLLCMLFTMLIGCGPTYQVMESKVYNEADLSAYKTFAVARLERDRIPPSMSYSDCEILVKAVEKQMIMRGYQMVKTDPQLLIYIGISVVDRVQTEQFNPIPRPYYFSRRAMWLRDYYSNVKFVTGVNQEGTLTVDVVDVMKEELVFSGSVYSVMDKQRHLREIDELDEAIADLFKNFPLDSTSY